MTGLIYARARWYDPSSGSFLSPDPMGYRDSSNLYAFAGGDPVNGRDPTGEATAQDAANWLSQKIENHRARMLGDDPGLARDFAANTSADILQMLPGVLSMGTQSGAELGEGASTWQVTQNRVYEAMPLEEARALIQDWDYLSGEDKARLISMGISKTAGLIAGTAGGVQAGGNLVRVARAPAPKPLVVPARGGAGPIRVGQAGEAVGSELSGYPKNTRRIRSASGKKDYRVPDHMNETGRHIVEDKAVKKQHLSSQIRDDKAFVLRDNGAGRVDVLIDESTQITPQLLREHLNPGSPIKLRTGKLKKQ